jgi:hypothetical protein
MNQQDELATLALQGPASPFRSKGTHALVGWLELGAATFKRFKRDEYDW